MVICTIKIGGYKRQGVGSVPLVEYSTSGKECSRGTPEERAIADAFKHACEQWGLCRHIDNQRYLAQYLRQYHDGRQSSLCPEKSESIHNAPPTKTVPRAR
ncbi:hypothetical protein [Coleofasciculus sp.]|uniref:hypothetical protein n=1 Tax=Coleofasciculus sp. TaxID=3100458 RepID=UPI0039F91548